ncbi:DUF4251 domain-containing protein [Paraprevotella xylaniphila]|uniref:DUF4251 domain-containing protein n=1 Tax=Paraprevotella xylaniphila TaxID=454155 RepID=UPI00266507FC|nr:DUF4251 domain-containing protein [Paraprevotella xylaniphila]
MRTKYCFFVIFLGLCPDLSKAQDTKPFDADSFNVDVTYMMPVSYPARTLSYGYGVALRNDSAFVYLPYMGRVYQPALNDDGLRFALPAKDVKARNMGDKGKRVEFSVRKVPVVYKFTVTGYEGGRADIILIPSNAQSISYSGYWNEENQP